MVDLDSDEKTLVRRMRDGDEQAFETFFDTNFQRLYRFTLSRLSRDTELARELTQAALCKAVEKLHTYREEAPLFSWLCTFCRYEISGHFRRLGRTPALVPLQEEIDEGGEGDSQLGSPPPDPERRLLQREAVDRIHEIMDQLPEHYATILEMKYTEGKSMREIAEWLSVTPKAVESLLARARKAFRDRYDSVTEPRNECTEPGRQLEFRRKTQDV